MTPESAEAAERLGFPRWKILPSTCSGCGTSSAMCGVSYRQERGALLCDLCAHPNPPSIREALKILEAISKAETLEVAVALARAALSAENG